MSYIKLKKISSLLFLITLLIIVITSIKYEGHTKLINATPLKQLVIKVNPYLSGKQILSGDTKCQGNNEAENIINWESDTNVDDYIVYRDGILLKDNYKTETYLDRALEPNTTYTYHVVGVNSGGSKPSLPLQLTTPNCFLPENKDEKAPVNLYEQLKAVFTELAEPFLERELEKEVDSDKLPEVFFLNTYFAPQPETIYEGDDILVDFRVIFRGLDTTNPFIFTIDLKNKSGFVLFKSIQEISLSDGTSVQDKEYINTRTFEQPLKLKEPLPAGTYELSASLVGENTYAPSFHFLTINKKGVTLSKLIFYFILGLPLWYFVKKYRALKDEDNNEEYSPEM